MSQNTDETISRAWVDELLGDLQSELGRKTIELAASRVDSRRLTEQVNHMAEELRSLSDQLAVATARAQPENEEYASEALGEG